MAMLTRSLHFTKPQTAYLQTEADKLGISVSEHLFTKVTSACVRLVSIFAGS